MELINATTLQDDIFKLKAKLKRHEQVLSISTSQLSKYYQLPITHCTFKDSTATFTMQVPIKAIFSMYAISSISMGKQSACSADAGNLCLVSRYQTDLTSYSPCHEFLLKPTVTAGDIKKYCPLRCVPSHPKTTHLFQLEHSKFAIITDKRLTFRCGNRKRRLEPPTIGVLEVEIPCNCELFLGDDNVSPNYPRLFIYLFIYLYDNSQLQK